MNVVAIIQARTGSTRLPNKVFSLLAGKPLIWHVFNRISYSKLITQCVLATTVNSNDETLIEWATANGINKFRGSEDDVLSRFYLAAKEYKADIIVRITADDPFKDPFLIDNVIDICLSEKLDFAYNNNPVSFPEGLDTEVFTFKALELAYNHSVDSFEREHITQYFYKNPELFLQKNLKNNVDYSWLRWTIDTQMDLDMSKIIYDNLFEEDKIFVYQDILDFLDQNTHLSKMNLLEKRSEMYK